jgi:CRISPR-associated endonuclease Cas3-HD
LQDVYVVCLRPLIAAYSKTVGLRLNKSGVEQSPDRTPPPRPGYASLRAEHWDKHARCVAAESAKRLNCSKLGQGLLEEGFSRRYQIDWAAIEAAVRACSLLHDLGKLQEPWQRWAEAAQKAQDATYQHSVALAHTDFDREKPQKQLLHIRRPPHAAASAYYGAAFLAEMLNSVCENRNVLASACAAAILAHHGGWLPGSMDLGIAKMWAGWEKPFADATGLSIQSQTMTKLEAQPDKRGSAQKLLGLAIGPDNIAKYWPLVAFLSRTLRLSDQRATAEGTSE